MIFTDIVQYLRIQLDDLGGIDDLGQEIPPDYDDDRLSVLLVASIRYLQTRLRVPKQCRLETFIEPRPFYVDPFVDINDDFVELIILRALCALQKRNIEGQFGMENVSVGLGPATLKTGNTTWGNMPKHIWENMPCAELEKKLLEWAAFDPRKLHVVYSILPRVTTSSGMVENNRWQEGGMSPRADMVQ